MSSKKPFAASPGSPLPLGPSRGDGWHNFSLFARHASSVVLVLGAATTNRKPVYTEIELDPALNRTGDLWHIRVAADGPLQYGYRVDGIDDPAAGRYFFPDRILIDPYCRHLVPRPWRAPTAYGVAPVCLSDHAKPFDWQGDRPLKTPLAETIIYELHVRGFTKHPNSQTTAPGTFAGIIEKIDYLKDLGVTAVELLPVTAWDETDTPFKHPESGARLLNFWGYNPVSFFALHSGLADDPADAVNECKTMVRSLHQAGIEVILDMVCNHTGESDYTQTTSSLRAIDNEVYYLIDEQSGDYLNFSGCGNTVNCNHPVVRSLILDALRYWVEEMHIDGFRFDLAAIFSRGTDGAIRTDPPLIEEIAEDPLLRDTKIIAEAWDAAGLYQVGSFSSDPRWLEWNGRFRDDCRRFLAGLPDTVSSLASRLAGSSDLYGPSSRGPLNSINFLTSHDGFSLYDLVSYETKRNHDNGEDNRDGEQHNLSWNSGHEGDPSPPDVQRLRRRRIRTAAGLLLLAQGVPMLTAGDEFARTQHGNNNSWCQDNEIGWVDWSLAETNQDLLRFFRSCIALRKNHRCFRREHFFPAESGDRRNNHPEISWQSLQPGQPDWSAECRTLALVLHDADDTSDFCVLINGSRSEAARFVVPPPPPRDTPTGWRQLIDTAADPPADFQDPTTAPPIEAATQLTVAAMGLVVLQAMPRSGPPASRARR